MESETTLAAGIRAANEESKYDAVCKELMSEKIVLAWILKTCAVEFAGYGWEFSHSHYEKVKKVYSIWICTNPAQKRRNSISRYSMAEESVIGDTHEKREHCLGVGNCCALQGLSAAFLYSLY